MPQVETSVSTVHGGRTDLAARRFPDAPQPWLDLSTGINPAAYDSAALASADPCALPLPSRLAELERVAARAFGLRTGAVAALPGSEIGLRLLATLGLPAQWCIATPGYGTHAAALPGARRLAPADARRVRAGTVLLANPNNPDGRVVPPADLLALARLLGEREGWLIVDEAFADVLPDASILPHLRAEDRVVVFRSFGKFYGLAGVRLGFVCGPVALVERFHALLGDWPVSAAAIEVGIAAYRDIAWQEATRASLARSAAALDAVLRRHGLDPVGACPLFRLVEHDDAAAVFGRLARAGILTRPFDDDPRWLRIGLPRDVAALDRLDRALGGG